MYLTSNQFPELKFLGTHSKPHGVSGIDKNYNMRFDPKLVHGTYAIHLIHRDCNSCTYSLDQPWIKGFTENQQPRYQPIKDLTYWPVLGSFDNWNIIKLSHKATSGEEIDKINQVVIDGINNNMDKLVQTGQYGAINTTYTAKMGYYVI